MWKKENRPYKLAEGFGPDMQVNLRQSTQAKPERPEPDSRVQPTGYTALDRSSIRKDGSSGDPTVIHQKSTVSGEITGNADVNICRNFQGTIETPKNIVTIEKNGYAKANINAKKINIHGKVFGNVAGSDTVHVLATGSVDGDIRSTNVILDKGATFNGSIEMVRDKNNSPSEGKSAPSKPMKPKKTEPVAATPPPKSPPMAAN